MIEVGSIVPMDRFGRGCGHRDDVPLPLACEETKS